MTAHEELLSLIPAYALDALDGDDVRRVEEHLGAGCDECERELLVATRQLEALAETVEPVVPSEMTRARLEHELDRRRPAAAAPARPARLLRAAAVAFALLAGWSIWTQLGLREELERQAASHESAVERLNQMRLELDRTQLMLSSFTRAGRIVAAPGTRGVVLAGLESTLEATSAASGQTFVDPDSRTAVFYAANLPELTEAETYQLWFIADGQPVSAGIFDVDESGSAMLLVDQTASVEEIQLWAVTVEPAGGVAQPAGQMVLKG